MSKKDTKDLLKFLSPFPEEVQSIALWLREFIWDQYPESNELIYDNYNALAFGWSPGDKVGDTFCSIAVGRSSYNVHFGFYWGAMIADPKKILLGNGNQYRYLLIKTKSDLPQAYIKKLMKEAYAYSLAKMKPVPTDKVIKGTTITKSISAVQRKPGKLTLKKYK
ncbi:MAG: hypothetical protein H0W12_01860 [Chitinophagaceae bacterium]|nr:hypothetical protein [Chitinophagaceae bacterium]